MQHSYEAADNRINRSLIGHLRFAYEYRTFFVYWVWRNILIRYSQTTVGLLWAVLQPLLSSMVYVVVFSIIARVSTKPVPYPLFVVTSMVLWSSWQRLLVSGASSAVNDIEIITRVSFPREVLPISIAGEALVDLLIGMVIVAFLFLIYQQPLTPYMLLAIPVFIIHGCLGLGLAFFLCGFSAYVRDVFQILPIALQLLLYISPVIYPIDAVPTRIRALYLINPLGPIFAAYQETLLFGRFTLGREMVVVGIVSVAVLILGYRYFKKAEWRFADSL